MRALLRSGHSDSSTFAANLKTLTQMLIWSRQEVWMQKEAGFWRGMSQAMRLRFVIGIFYLGLAFALLSQFPILGTVLLVLPILWTVCVIWIGSEEGVSFGPYHRARETTLGHLLQYLWHASGLTKLVLSVALGIALIGGLGWVSTEKMRAEALEPSLSERVSTVAENATEATRETAGGWFSTARGWFAGGNKEP